MIIFSILPTLFIGTTFILDRGENDYFPLARLVKNTFVPMLHFKKATLCRKLCGVLLPLSL